LIVDIGVPVAVSITERSFSEMGLKNKMQVWISFKASAARFLLHA
jgi:hypothetical protein